MKLVKMSLSATAIGLLLAVLAHAGADAASDEKPDGRYVCEGVYDDNGKLSWKTIEITIGRDFPRGPDAHPDAGVQVHGLGENNAAYLFHPKQLIIFAPHTCFVGKSSRQFSACAYVGILDLTSGGFVFYKGDYPDGEPFYWAQKQNEKICVKTE